MSQKPNILVVDDEPDVCDALKEFLGKQGYRVMAAHSGEEAVGLLAENNFDLIILDMVLPGMSGLDVMDYISSNNLAALVIVMTGYASTDSAVESFRKRAYDYVIKPSDFSDLLTRVKNAVNYKRSEEERVRAEEALREAHDELEQWVEERTELLAAANERLSEETDKRKRAESQIKASVKEKEMLLRDIHHGVKNHLKIVSDLLDMMITRTQNREAIKLLGESRSRVQTMALVHMQLYKGEQFDLVPMEEFWGDLLPLLRRAYEVREAGIQVLIEPTDVMLPIDKAVPCSLVVNELVSNSFKHAFKEREEGSVEISFGRADNDSVLLIVRDDGIGMPEDLDIEKADTLGLRLTGSIVRDQLKGKMKIEQHMGTVVEIEFPL
jgi:two-component sensor histidine kinase/CheY-like chemotaxis protein